MESSQCRQSAAAVGVRSGTARTGTVSASQCRQRAARRSLREFAPDALPRPVLSQSVGYPQR